MQIYTIRYHQGDSASGTVQEWFTSRADAKRRMAELNRQYSGASEGDFAWFTDEPQAIRIETTRPQLVAFLNRWANAGGDALA